MGAWGHGHFENDSALDFEAEIMESGNPKEIFIGVLDTALESDFLEVDEGSAVVVTAAYIDSHVNGTRFSPHESRLLEVDFFRARFPGVDLSDLKEKAVAALKKVLGGESELNGLWTENSDEYHLWRNEVEQLMRHLIK